MCKVYVPQNAERRVQETYGEKRYAATRKWQRKICASDLVQEKETHNGERMVIVAEGKMQNARRWLQRCED